MNEMKVVKLYVQSGQNCSVRSRPRLRTKAKIWLAGGNFTLRMWGCSERISKEKCSKGE